MNKFITKKLTYLFALASFCCANGALYAEFLLFKPGNKASYTISQKIVSEYGIFNETTYTQSEAIIDLDIKVLSSNRETLSYPFEVEVTLKKVLISEIQQNDYSSTTIRYDSNGLEVNALTEYFDKLIDYPLVFRVKKDFQIEETTSYLNSLDEKFDSPSPMGLFGTTPWTFELLLTQLFHLSGENLLSTNSYPVSCYQFLNWEDEALDERESCIDQTGAYKVNAIDSKKIEASWIGNAKVTSSEDYMNMKGKVSVIGNVTWNIANPMIQKRDLEVKIEQKYNGIFPAHVKMSAQQTWRPV